MSRIRIDLDQLTIALSDHHSEWVLDTRTGQIVMAEWLRDPDLREDLDLDLAPEDGAGGDDELNALDPLESGRFVFIEPVPSYEGFRWMEDFADRQDELVRERLLDSLDRPRPFRRFKDALEAFPQVREAWFAYEDQQLTEYARDWLRSRETDAELVERPPPPASA